MNFALLGVDPDALELVSLLCASRDHELRVAYDVGQQLAALRVLAPRVEVGDAPESLLARPEIDAVIVANATDSDARERQLRTLVQGGLRLVVILPMCDSLTAYELEMIREENSAVIVPYTPGRGHPAMGRLAELIEEGAASSLGLVEQIVFERPLAHRSKEAVIQQLAADGHLLGRLIGDIESVSATGDRDDPYKNLSVGLTGASGLTARWNVVPATHDSASTIALRGERGQATLSLTVDGPWQIQINHENRQSPSWPDWDPVAAVVAELDGQPSGLGSWFEACRDLELVDHVATSLRRQRTIEIRRDGNPEENAFKGIMSAGGCLMLMICLLLMLVFAIVEGLRMPLLTSPEEVLEMRDQEKTRWHFLWRLWPVYPLLAFLAMQALLLVAKAGRNERAQNLE